MSDMASALIWVGGTLTGISILCFTALKAWRGWLELRREEMVSRQPGEAQAQAETGARIEIADVRERLRKLEAIAKGVDL